MRQLRAHHPLLLLERPYDSGSWDDGRLDLRPFQIVTLRFGRADAE